MTPTFGRPSFPSAVPLDLPVGDRASARLRVLLGQPVKLGGASFGVVRIALGADMLIDAFCEGNSATAEDKDDTPTGTGGAVDHLIAQVGRWKVSPYMQSYRAARFVYYHISFFSGSLANAPSCIGGRGGGAGFWFRNTPGGWVAKRETRFALQENILPWHPRGVPSITPSNAGVGDDNEASPGSMVRETPNKKPVSHTHTHTLLFLGRGCNVPYKFIHSCTQCFCLLCFGAADARTGI